MPAKLDEAAAAHHAERVQLQEHHTAAERHWLLEVDRSRQLATEAANRHERQVGKLRRLQKFNRNFATYGRGIDHLSAGNFVADELLNPCRHLLYKLIHRFRRT